MENESVFDPSQFVREGDEWAGDEELVRGRVKVVWDHNGEGYYGYYDPGDPDDVELLRFSFYGRHRGEWLYCEDSSFCTRVPAETPPGVLRALLVHLMDEGAPSVEQGLELAGDEAVGELRPGSRRVFEELSWISPEWVGYRP